MDFIPYCLIPQANCLNALFYLHQTKSKFIPTYSHRISTFYISLESLKHKEAKKFCVYFSTYALKGNLHNFSFSQTDPLGLDNFTNSFCWVKGYSKMYNLSWFEHFLFLLKNLIIYKKKTLQPFLKTNIFPFTKFNPNPIILISTFFLPTYW